MREFVGFMRSRLAEAILLAVCSAALFSTVVYGFHVDDELRGFWPAIVGLPAVLVACFTAMSFTPRSVIAGSIAFVACFAAVAVGSSMACGHAFFYDEYGNVGFYLLLGTLTTLAGYLMTRRKSLMYLYAVGGCFTCGLVQFLYVNDLVVQAFVFVLAAIALCVVCGRRLQGKAIASDDVAAWQYAACGVGMAAVAVGVAVAVFALVVVPLDPPARELKLVTEYYALETVHVRGEQRVEHQENDSLVSDSQVDGDKQTNLENGQTEEVYGGQSSSEGNDDAGDANPGMQRYHTSVFGDAMSAVDYFHELSRLLFVLPAVLVALVLAVAAKLASRRRRFKRMCALPARDSIVSFYRFFDGRLPLLGVERNEAATPLEHSRNVASMVGLLEREAAGASFAQMTDAYCACVYGNAEPRDSDLACCRELYRVFYGNARKLVGLPRYVRRFFRL